MFPDVENVVAPDQNLPQFSLALPIDDFLRVGQLQLTNNYQQVHVLILRLENPPQLPSPFQLNAYYFPMKSQQKRLRVHHLHLNNMNAYR